MEFFKSRPLPVLFISAFCFWGALNAVNQGITANTLLICFSQLGAGISLLFLKRTAIIFHGIVLIYAVGATLYLFFYTGHFKPPQTIVVYGMGFTIILSLLFFLYTIRLDRQNRLD